MSTSHPYPFSALVGTDDLRLALALNAVSPAIGGVLVRGEKGTAKSTAVRGLAALLPPIEVVAGCRFSCVPGAPDVDCPDGPHTADGAEQRPARLAELPVGASEDRVAGSLDIERALREGTRAFEPGLLAEAHRGVLYVDEVNLLGDHLVDLLLDAAAMGRNIVEREGVSVRHAARFQLVGTMNPEEGELRPQLLDRFGLTVEVSASREPAQRAEVVRRRLAYESDPEGFAGAYADTDAQVAARIVGARKLLAEVQLGDEALDAIVRVCASFEVDGLRADIVTAKTAAALAAWEERTAVSLDDVRAAALLALPHRRRRGPFEQPGLDEERLDEALGDRGDDDPPPPDGGDGSAGGAPHDGSSETAQVPSETTADAGQAGEQSSQPPGDAGRHGRASQGAADPSGTQEQVLRVGATFAPVLLEVPGTGAGAWGRRSRSRSDRGRTVGARVPDTRVTDLALAATIRAAAVHGRRVVRPQDLRTKLREGREGNLVLFAVDASGSMAAHRRMTAVKGAIASLLADAYQRRDRVGLVTFRGEEGRVALPPTASVDRAVTLLADLPTGGRTPLSAGIEQAARVLASERVRDPRRRPLLVLLTDGRATSAGGVEAAERAAAGLAARAVVGVVVDTEEGHVRLGLAGRVAAALGGPCLRLEELAAGSLAGVVRDITRRAA